MKIGLVIYGSLDTLSGGYLYDRKLVEYLRAQGDTVEVISLPWRNYAAHLTDNLSFRLPRGLDLVIEDELNHPSLIAANRRPHPYPVVSLVHHLRSSEERPAWQNSFYRWVEKVYLQSVDGFILNSRTTEEVVGRLVRGGLGEGKQVESRRVESRQRESRQGVGGRKSVVAYPPTDRFGEMIAPHEIRARADSDEFRVVFLGNAIRRKGLHTLLEAMARLQTSDLTSAVSLDVIGAVELEPAYARQMMREAEVEGLRSKVYFHGPLDKDQLIPNLRQSHVLVVPSSYEGYGIVYLEGMGFGLPAIGTTAGAAGEIITDGQNGYLIPPGDAEGLAAILSFLATDRQLLARLSLNALDRYRTQPKWEQTAGKIRAFLHGMTGK